MKTSQKISSLILLFAVILFSCNKKDSLSQKDTDKPVITLKGEADMIVGRNSNASDPGATATDETDGDISSSILSDWNSAVNQNENGSYTVNYSVSDKAGNKSIATRKVTVKTTASGLTGEYKTIFANSYGTSTVNNTTVTIGSNPLQLVFNPVFIVYTVPADLSGPFNDNFTFDYYQNNNHLSGNGIIENSGKKITINGLIVTGTGTQTFTQTMTKD